MRTNQVIVAPVPGTKMRYQAKTLAAAPLKYDNTMAPMGCLPADLNQDGKMDLLVYYWGRPPIAFMQAKQEFNFYPTNIVTDGFERWFTNAATVADIDGDGHLDIIIANYFQDGAHILDPNSKIPDEMQHSMSRAYNAGGTYFFLGQPDNTFRKINGTEVLDKQSNYAWTLALGAADLDGDMLPELYFANDFGPDRLLHNRSTPGNLNFALLEGKRGFTTPASKVVGKDSFKGMGVDFADINGDGWLDIFVSNIAAEYALEESHFLFVSTGEVELMKQGIAPYVDLSEPLGVSRSDWSWDNKFADFNNDGQAEIIQTTGFLKGKINRWPELQQIAIGNDELLKYPQYWPRLQYPHDDLSGYKPNPFYTRAANGRYINIAAELGLDQLQVSRGIAVADVDGDGDLDFALANQWEDSHFYRNNCPNTCGNYLGLHIRRTNNKQVTVYKGHPTKISSPAIGAAIKVTLPNKRVLVAQVDGGNGHSGKRSPDLHFGLNKLDSNLKVEVSWRNSQGKVNKEVLSLAPGWHTIELN
ncbi:CRTAC1 family protein [Candidatus Marithrix sp. Canyon 246]|uniref:CRTAC1 family protein n=1 Tax=Candidatus Marithrix sp. Canyon 246 TaxID=1827136 RepID=UPI000849F477|nr:CRTAC1 family protein [Candidatus Marithrix sp. Canyon 246]